VLERQLQLIFGIIPLTLAILSGLLLAWDLLFGKNYDGYLAWHRDSTILLAQKIIFCSCVVQTYVNVAKFDKESISEFSYQDNIVILQPLLILSILLVLMILLTSHRNQGTWLILSLCFLT